MNTISVSHLYLVYLENTSEIDVNTFHEHFCTGPQLSIEIVSLSPSSYSEHFLS